MSAVELMAKAVARRTFQEVRSLLRTNPKALRDEVDKAMDPENEEASVHPDSEQSNEGATLYAGQMRRATRTYQALSQAEQDKLGLMVKGLGGNRSDLDRLIG
jgi:hypothetical protein